MRRRPTQESGIEQAREVDRQELVPDGRSPKVERLERGPERELCSVGRNKVFFHFGGDLSCASTLCDDDDGREESGDVDWTKDNFVEQNFGHDEFGRAAQEARGHEGVEPSIPRMPEGTHHSGAVESRGREVARGEREGERGRRGLILGVCCSSSSSCFARGRGLASAGR